MNCPTTQAKADSLEMEQASHQKGLGSLEAQKNLFEVSMWVWIQQKELDWHRELPMKDSEKTWK